MPKIRITNITSFLHPPGFGLDYMKRYIGPNPARPLIIEVPVIDDVLEKWKELKWVSVRDADDKTAVTKESESIVSPPAVSEAKASELADDIMADDVFDFSIAKEAALPGDIAEKAGPAPLGPINQMMSNEERMARAKVTMGSEKLMNAADTLSPIPGDRPTSIDNSDAFTVRAPRQSGPGAVIKSS